MWSFTCSTGSCMPFATTFGVLFPAATGIMEGANLSGDLANPTYSIPVGTLSAVATAIFFYSLLIFAFGGSFNQCTLRYDTTIMQESAWGDVGTYLVVAGIMISASSSALGSLFGGSRVLQAIARDELFPYTRWFTYGSPKGDEPRTAVLFTWVIAQSLIFIGSINAIAPISTSFFCLSYCTVNFSCFLLEISGTPNFRPSFSYYTWHISLLGTISNLAVMFFVDYRFGFAALICEIAVFVFLAYRAPQNVWGDVTQSIIFHQVRKYLLRLDSRKAHSKTWRPSLLLLADCEEIALIDFCNNLKKGGLYIIGSAICGDFADKVGLTRLLKQEWIEFIDKNSLKAFPQIAVANTLRSGYENLILLSGLGAMEPNTIVLPMLRLKKMSKDVHSMMSDDSHDENDDLEEEDEKENKMTLKSLVRQSPAQMDAVQYVKLCANILKFNRNIVMAANMHSLDFELVVSQKIAEAMEQNIANHHIYNNDNDNVNVVNDKNINSNFEISDSQTNATQTSRSGTNYWTFTSQATPNIRNQWVDIWLFADDYSFNLKERSIKDSGFPMLIMQLSHILLQNKVWDKAAGLRVFLLVNSKWNESDQLNFDTIVKDLRLGIDQVVVLKQPSVGKPEWNEIIDGNAKKKRQFKKYYKTLNSTMTSLSSQTYFTFLKLPCLPPIDEINDGNEKLAILYFEAMYILLKQMPPCCMVGTGEELPVISMDI